MSPSVNYSQHSLRHSSINSDSSSEVFENDTEDNLPIFSGSLPGSNPLTNDVHVGVCTCMHYYCVNVFCHGVQFPMQYMLYVMYLLLHVYVHICATTVFE